MRPVAFAVEQWMNKYENRPGILNVAETCASSISMDELIDLSEDHNTGLPFKTSTRLTYGSILGSSALRSSIAALYNQEGKPRLTEDDVIVSQGGIGANFLVLYSMLKPTDHVICVYPTYQQLYSVPESLGAEVSLWKLRAENSWIPDVSELPSLVRHNTKMIIINNPNNPTGTTIPTQVLLQIADFAKPRGIIIFSDEIYRPLFHNALDPDTDTPLPVTSLDYEKTIVTGSMSKAFALAGLRIGWVVSRNKDLMADLAHTRDYTTISVSQVDDQIATYALSPSVQPALMRRNVMLAKSNLALLKAFVDKHKAHISWTCPNAGTIAFLRFTSEGKPVEDLAFCEDLLAKMNVFITPGSHCFGQDVDFAGYVRLGYVCETRVLEEALAKFSAYIEDHLNG